MTRLALTCTSHVFHPHDDHRFKCRTCTGLMYYCQRVDERHRLLARMIGIRDQLDGLALAGDDGERYGRLGFRGGRGPELARQAFQVFAFTGAELHRHMVLLSMLEA